MKKPMRKYTNDVMSAPITDIPTKKLNNGIEVLAKLYKGEPSAITYANRTQAENKVSALGPEWVVYRGGGRPFFVARASQFPN